MVTKSVMVPSRPSWVREHEHRAGDAERELRRLLADGVRRLTGAFERLSSNRHGDNDHTATAAAAAAVKTQRQLERVDRKAASALLTVDDLREVIGRRELDRRFSRVSETLDRGRRPRLVRHRQGRLKVVVRAAGEV